MGLKANTEAFDRRYRPIVDQMRGLAPAGVLESLIAAETGGVGGQFSVANDKHLAESGYSQEPIFIALKHNVNPFDAIGGIWLRCRCTQDAALDILRVWPSVVPMTGRDLWYCTMMRYSIGPNAIDHVLQCVSALGWDGCLEDRIVQWATVTDLALPIHRHHWGRQKPDKIKFRLTDAGHRNRLTVASMFSPLDGAPGLEPSIDRPSVADAFPGELIRAAKMCRANDASDDEIDKAWHEVDAFARKLRKQSGVPKAPVTWRIANFLRPKLIRHYHINERAAA